MKKKLIKNVIAALLILFVGINGFLSIQFGIKLISGFVNIGVSTKRVEHYSSSGNFTISLPETWFPTDITHGNHGDKSVVLIIENISENLYIDVSKYENINSDGDIKDLVIKKINAESKGTYTSISVENFQGKKYSGLLNEYTTTIVHPFLGKRDFHCLGWYVQPKINVGYSFLFCVEEKNWEKAKDTFFEIINSVQFE